MIDIAKADEAISRTLGEKRYTHSVYVAHTAVELAKTFGADSEKAFVAGLLHDCAKAMSFQESLGAAEKYNVTLDEATLLCPPVIHADIGAAVAEHEYGITDTEILDAIRYHTVARANMTLLDKIIYVADIIEPTRSFSGIDVLRKLAKTDIDAAFCETLRFSLRYNLEKGNIIHPASIAAWNEILKNKREEKL